MEEQKRRMDEQQIHTYKIIAGVLIMLIVLVFVWGILLQNSSNEDVITVLECADTIDNDSDGRQDRNDPACWNDPRDPATYVEENKEESVSAHKMVLEVPKRVPLGDSASLKWQAANVLEGTCAVLGSNGDGPWEQDSGLIKSSPLDVVTIFTLKCRDLKNDLVAKQYAVNIMR